MSTFFNNLKSSITNIENKIASFNKKDEEEGSGDIQKQQEQENGDDDSKTLTEETIDKLKVEGHKEGQASKSTLFANKMLGMAIKASTKIQEKATNFTPLKIIGTFEQERQKFIDELESEKRTKSEDSSQLCLLLNNPEAKKHILSISSDTKNFIEDLPISSDIGTEVEEIKANAKAFFELDPRLEDVRFELVPKRINEGKFWENYAYKLSLVKKVVGDKPSIIEIQDEQFNQEEPKTSGIDENDKDKDSSKIDKDDSLEKDLFEDFDEFEVVNESSSSKKSEEDNNKIVLDDELNDEIAALLDDDK